MLQRALISAVVLASAISLPNSPAQLSSFNQSKKNTGQWYAGACRAPAMKQFSRSEKS
jgi:hypothetical protein